MSSIKTGSKDLLLYSTFSSNRNENNICCSGRLLLYSRCRRPIIFDVVEGRNLEIQDANKDHQDNINGQCFVYNDDLGTNSGHFITTSYDKTAKIWQFNLEGASKIICTFLSPNNETFISRSCLKHEAQYISLTTSIDGNIYLWQNDKLKRTLTTGYCCFYSKIFSVENAKQRFTFAFLAGSDNKVHIFQVDLNDLNLNHVLDLPGHNDWIKCVDILPLDRPQTCEFLLASASQDTFVRIWLMRLETEESNTTRIRTIVSKAISSHTSALRLTATLETVLSGHGGMITGLCWFKQIRNGKLKLVTCSADKTIIVWESLVVKSSFYPEARSESDHTFHKYEQLPASEGKWAEIARFGETGETNLPFLGVCLSHDDDIIFAHSLRGAIHAWGPSKGCQFVPLYSITGHSEPVTDLAWEQSGKYLLTVSQDKTCRLHSIAARDNKWYEIARPQVHGHEINCVAAIDSLRFASGAEEKVVRVFGSTRFFIKNHDALAREKLGIDSTSLEEDELPAHAQLPALGLSIRGASSPYDVDMFKGDENLSGKSKKASDNTSEWHEVSKLVKEMSKVDHLENIPVEEILLQSTLWWERNKLFGHGNELHALAVDSMGEFLASASKANRDDLAKVIVWDCSKFRKVATISHHSLTVTRLRFSPNSRYLLSVSRDRTWCLSERNPSGQLRNAYKKVLGTTKQDAFHERIIWDCSWTPDSMYFMTVSRDKKAVLWNMNHLINTKVEDSGEHEKLTSFSSRTFECSIQAVDCRLIRAASSSSYLFAFGLESGSIDLYSLMPVGVSENLPEKCLWDCIRRLDNYHQLSINRLAFKPDNGPTSVDSPTILASGADDCVVKLIQLQL